MTKPRKHTPAQLAAAEQLAHHVYDNHAPCPRCPPERRAGIRGRLREEAQRVAEEAADHPPAEDA